jgi:hypothetical protein
LASPSFARGIGCLPNSVVGCFSDIGGDELMKVLFVFLALLILSNLACQTSAFKSENVAAQAMPTTNIANDNNSNRPQPVPVEQSNLSQFEAQNEKFTVVPENFKRIEFKNFSYPYKFSYDGRKINIALNDGEYEYETKPSGGGWFNLSDVFYVDLTNDKSPEAIVLLWHVSCGGSCDGGAGLFYIYTLEQNKLKPLWQFESDSLAYGCGLKSFTVKDKKITMELFGRCFDKTEESVGMSKFQVKDTTRLTFGFNGKKIVEEKKEFIAVPTRSVLNYQPEIRINE